ncbi:hypothetical protein BKA57DRAFT_93137 [Linnemannia elongata]|nr:hypothetical protein BKA57DRAFT_93137 [Linnemannia elongata]
MFILKLISFQCISSLGPCWSIFAGEKAAGHKYPQVGGGPSILTPSECSLLPKSVVFLFLDLLDPWRPTTIPWITVLVPYRIRIAGLLAWSLTTLHRSTTYSVSYQKWMQVRCIYLFIN